MIAAKHDLQTDIPQFISSESLSFVPPPQYLPVRQVLNEIIGTPADVAVKYLGLYVGTLLNWIIKINDLKFLAFSKLSNCKNI